ncbi:MAG: phosphoribosylaminoimidazolesuccinocarboxamide synthase [Candidatus Izemoplasma sp.]|nr:phosphoribosylaminoimidazolesuccinocarboxamide synthase [Candidatus Izemoplasma sp.]
MNKLLYEGKAKQIYASDNANEVIIHYKDDATAFNGVKKAEIENKGILNNKISAIIFTYLKQKGIPTHFIERINARDQRCHNVNIFPLEFIVRNVVAGSMAKRLHIKEGTIPPNTIYEICYKNDALGDPLINDHHAVALNLCSYEELKTMYDLTKDINHYLTELFHQEKITLVDFKIEFGKTVDGTIVLADEISPDTCRLWDSETQEKLDKDRFRRDLGSIEEAYVEILNRITM